jgi:hypothetical protein
MIVAAVLNRLTTRTRISTILWVTADTAEVVLHLSTITPADLEVALSPVQGRLRAREGQARQQGERISAGRPADLVDVLARLAELHRAGALDDEEYVRSKAKLLG